MLDCLKIKEDSVEIILGRTEHRKTLHDQYYLIIPNNCKYFFFICTVQTC